MQRIVRCVSWAVLSVSLGASGAEQANLDDKLALEAFVDGVVKTSIKRHHIAGAVVSILSKDEVILAKGYGYADVESKVPVDPAKTLFRIGSVSKLFTYTALMQLHEQGSLDLDANIQDYLTDLKIPATFAEPILVKHLFTHTAGFEDRFIGLFAKDEDKLLPYGELLSKDLPSRVRKPGLVSSYSNHSLGIAGLIIENISGMSWPAYIRAHILDPLGMQYATAYQPVPESLQPTSSTGYRWLNGKYKAQPFEYVPLASAGTMSASAVAMTQFMRLQLNGGTVDGNRILKTSTLAQMHTPLYNSHESLDPMLYGFFKTSVPGRNTLGHGGATLQFFTNFQLLPDEDMGFFVSTNTAGGRSVIRELSSALLERYFPSQQEIAQIAKPSDLQSIVGTYGTYRHPFTSAGKVIRAMGEVSVVEAAPGQITIRGLGSDPVFALESSPMVFQTTENKINVVFDTDEFGQQRMFVGSALRSFYKLGVMDMRQTHIILLAICSILFLWVLIAWPLQRFLTTRLPTDFEHRSRWSFWLLSIVTLITLLGISVSISEEIVYGLDSVTAFFMNFAYLVPLMTLVSMAMLVRLATDRGTEMHIRAFHCLLGVAALALCWMLGYWNFIGV